MASGLSSPEPWHSRWQGHLELNGNNKHESAATQGKKQKKHCNKNPTSTTTMIVLPNLLHLEGPSCYGVDGTWAGIKSTKEGAVVPPGLIHQVQSTVPLKDGQATLGAGEHFHLCCGCGPAESQ